MNMLYVEFIEYFVILIAYYRALENGDLDIFLDAPNYEYDSAPTFTFMKVP